MGGLSEALSAWRAPERVLQKRAGYRWVVLGEREQRGAALVGLARQQHLRPRTHIEFHYHNMHAIIPAGMKTSSPTSTLLHDLQKVAPANHTERRY